MPFTLKTAPKNVKKLDKNLQNIWINSFNAALKKKGNTEQIAFKSAWNSVNEKRGHKSDGTKIPQDKEHKKKKKVKQMKDSNEEDPKGDLVIEEPSDDVPEDNMKDGEFVIQIKDEIGWDVTAESVNKQLEKADGQKVIFEIASPGGSVFEGVEIFNAIRNYKGDTEARIVGMAASMASYIPLATDKVLAEDNATFMIHNAWGIAIGDSEEMKSEAEILASINDMLAQEYTNKTGKSEKEILQMMTDETWLFGSEIKEAGFIDEMIVHKDDDSKDKKKDKEASITEAKDKFKSILSKIREKRMKSDLEKMKSKLNLKHGGNKMMSKFGELSVDKLSKVVETLRGLAENKKPADEISIPVKNVSLLIQDIEEVIKSEEETNEETSDNSEENEDKEEKKETKTEETKEKKNKKDKKEDKKESKEEKKEDSEEPDKSDEEKDVKETNEEEGSDSDGDKEEKDPKEDKESSAEGEDTDESKNESESKFKELLKVCDGYKKECNDKDAQISKFTTELKKLNKEKEELTQKISKFKKESYEQILNSTVDKISKFRHLDETQKLALKQRYLESKMSETALEEVGRVTDDQMFSKLAEPKETTQPSEMLDPVDVDEGPDFSKMSEKEIKAHKLDELAELQARQRGFVG